MAEKQNDKNKTVQKKKRTTTKQRNLDLAREQLEAYEATGKVKMLEKRQGANQLPSVQDGDNARYVKFCMEIAELGMTCNTKDPEDMKNHFRQYLQLAFKYDMKLGNLQAYAAMGISKQMADYMEHRRDLYRQEFADVIRTVRNVCGMYREQLMADQKLNPIVGIFWQRNYDKLTNNDDVERVDPNEFAQQKTPDEIAKEYDLIEE